MTSPLAEQVTSAVQTFGAETSEQLAGHPDVAADVLAQVSEYMARKVADVILVARTLDDEQELARTVAYIWCELKCEWVRYNQVMQYQLANTGEADPAIWLKGSVASGLLAALEPLLPPAQLEALDVMLSDPLQIARPDDALLGDLRQQHLKNGKLVGTISAEINSLFRAVLDVQDRLLQASRAGGEMDSLALLQGLVDRFDTSFATLRTSLRHDNRTPFAAMWRILQGDLQHQAQTLALRCQFTDASPPDAAIDAQHVESLLGCWFAAGRFLMLGLTAETTVQRRERDKSLHQHVDVRCTVAPDCGTLSFHDDGPGLAPAAFQAGQAEAWDRLIEVCNAVCVTVDYVQVDGESATLTLRWAPFRYEQAEALMIVRHGGALYGLPVAQISRVVAVEPGALRQVAGSPLFHWQQHAYGWIELPRPLALTVDSEIAAPSHAALLEVDGERLAIGIDGVEQLHAAIVQPVTTMAFDMPPYLRGVVRYSGALCLVVDPGQLRAIRAEDHVPTAL
ncbi:MAG: chemotaxis protein CheW [Candidatus Sericytochromatia bacterium]|nr:chemotaxis protein CheW [Candidatus Sericytochromatia bacterium]